LLSPDSTASWVNPSITLYVGPDLCLRTRRRLTLRTSVAGSPRFRAPAFCCASFTERLFRSRLLAPI
jgi:hypothetical protein